MAKTGQDHFVGQEKPHADVAHVERQAGGKGDNDKGSMIYQAGEDGGATEMVVASTVDPKAERKLLWKLDVCILAFAIMLYLSAYLDRSNIANARLMGIEEDILNGNDTNYAIALSCFYITYIIFAIPGTLMAKQINPSRSIAAGVMIWSIAATCQAAAFNPAGLFVCRLFVGFGEAFFAQAMAFYLSLWYTKHDLAKRVGIWVSAGAIAGAFGGLIAFGVNSIKQSSIPLWAIFFLIEGCPSLLLAIATFFFFPSRPETSKYLTEDERILCLTRLGRLEGNAAKEGVDWKGVRRCCKDWKTYLIAVMYSCMNLTLGSVSGFLPTIIKGFGYSDAKAQLFTVPPYVVALVVMLLLTTFSDKRQARGFPIMSIFIVGIIGWTILLTIPATTSQSGYSARYFACCCVVTAGYTNIPLIISWTVANNPQESQRACALGFLNSIGQCLSLAASYLFPKAEGPNYIKGAAINIGCSSVGLIIAFSMTMYYRLENRRRDKTEGRPAERGPSVEDVHTMYDRAPGFRYTT